MTLRRKLSALLAAVVLQTLIFATPASAATTVTSSETWFETGLGTQPFTVSGTTSGTVFDPSASTPTGLYRITIQIHKGNDYWNVVNTCPRHTTTGAPDINTFAGTMSTCGISAITLNGVSINTNQVKIAAINPSSAPQVMNMYIAFPTTVALPAGSNWSISFNQGAFVAGPIQTEVTLTAQFNGENAIQTYLQPNIMTSYTTVSFDSNGGSGSMARQPGASSTALTANAFTKSGKVFGGWATSLSDANAGTVAYANGANYPFTSAGTLYAIWNDAPAGGSASDAALANTGNKSQLPIALIGLMFLFAGISVYSGSIALKRRPTK